MDSTDDAIYHERVLGEPIRTRAGIRDYWQSKVPDGQADIDARLLNLYTVTDGTTVIAEWEATFDGEKIAGLREYWTSETVA